MGAQEAVLSFDENVTVDTTNGTPSVIFNLGENQAEKTTAPPFRCPMAADEGPYSEALLEADSLALNGGTIRSAATQVDASLGHNGAGLINPRHIGSTVEDGPTAAFSNVPASHDGESTFEVGLAFSGESGMTSQVTVRDSLVETAGVRIEQAGRKTQGSNVTLTLPLYMCSEANAVCIAGKPIMRAATVEGPPLVRDDGRSTATTEGMREL